MAIAPELLAGDAAGGEGAVAHADDDGWIRNRDDGTPLPKARRAPRGSYMTRSGAVITPARRRTDRTRLNDPQPRRGSPHPAPTSSPSRSSTSPAARSLPAPRVPGVYSGGPLSRLIVAIAAGLVTLEFVALLTGQTFKLAFPHVGQAAPQQPTMRFTDRYAAAVAALQGTGHGG